MNEVPNPVGISPYISGLEAEDYGEKTGMVGSVWSAAKDGEIIRSLICEILSDGSKSCMGCWLCGIRQTK